MGSRGRVPLAILTLLVVGASVVGLGLSARAQDEDLARIDAFVEAQMRRHRIPGLALVITQGDRVIHQRGFGTAGDGRPVTAETPFHIGSISKSFTALAVMQLVEQDRVELDAPVQTYLPWFRVAEEDASPAITVRHLLHQTSGLAEETYMADLPPGTTLEEAVRDLRRAEPVDPPGAAFHYFNQNYATLGLIVETVSGQPYGEYVRRSIFEPLQMDHSAATVERIARLDVARGHGVVFGFPIARRQETAAYSMAEGGIVSSAEDLAHFLIAQNNDGLYEGARLLSAERVAWMHQPRTPGAPPGQGYAMGWVVDERDGSPILEHGGSLENFRTFAWLLPEQSYSFAVLMNQNGFVPAMLAYSDIPEGIAALLLEGEPSTGPAMRVVYWAFTAVMAAVIGLDAAWWVGRFPARWTGGGARSTGLWIGVAGGLIRAGLFYALPYALLRGLGRGFTWRLAFAMAPSVALFIAWNAAMGATKSLARVVTLLRR